MRFLKSGRQTTFDEGLNILIKVIAVVAVAYHLIAIFLHPLDSVLHANSHLAFIFLMVLLPSLQTALQKKRRFSSLVISILLLMGLVGTAYVYLNSEGLQLRAGIPTTLDLAMGSLLVIVVFESTRRAWGMVLPIFGVLFLAYAFFGDLLPHPFYHPPISFPRVMSWLGVSLSSGIYGSLIYISANIIFLFVLFGVVLRITKAQEFFSLLGMLVGRKIRGGSAQTSVISSGFVGMITGSAAANIIITGAVTIPLMKKTGFRPEFAAAVEAVSSSGGILMPPVMGAVAFMMMSMTGLSYWTICVAAFVPAILYYLGIGLSVHMHAGKKNIPPIEEEVDLRLLLRRAPLFIVPFGVITILLALQFSPTYAAGWALVVGVVLGYMRKETRPSWSFLVEALTIGAKTAASIGTILILLNMSMITVMSLTAVGPKVAFVIYEWGMGMLPLILLMTMIVSILLGTMAPMAGTYLLVALVVTPLLLKLGLTLPQAHFFALYYAVLGFLTPPVAPAVLIATPLAGANFLRTVPAAMKLVGSAYLLPFLFCYDPALLLDFNRGLWLGLLSIGVAVLAILSISIFLYRYFLVELGWLETGLAAISAVGFLAYFFTRGDISGVVIGAVCLILLTLWQWVKKRAIKIVPA
jgi:TRAP transporter 4TM/12TM fusion protein